MAWIVVFGIPIAIVVVALVTLGVLVYEGWERDDPAGLHDDPSQKRTLDYPGKP
ncbi:MAG: hypothetical protein WD894_12540 [Pirellulales bacterium]